MDIKEALQNQQISQEAFDNLNKWLTDSRFSEFAPALQQAVDAGDWQNLENSFYTRIAIGTGGIRGPIGFGPNRINSRTIGEAAQGLSQFIHDFGDVAVKGGVVIGYDSRKFAKEFAQISGEVFAANGIQVYFFESLRATPEISFAVRHLKATAGVMITASHNPRTDNGFKFYWSDGGQVVPPNDAKFMQLVTDVTDIQRMPFEEAVEKNLIKTIGKEVDDAYFEKLKSLSLSKNRGAKIVFSPMHGSGSTNVLPLLKSQGFEVVVVPEQAEPNSEFPTAHGDLINPEFPEVMQMAVELGKKEQADIVLVSDPDADRIGVAAPDQSGGMRLFTGDEVGAIICNYILDQRKQNNSLPQNGVVLETYVTTTLISDITKSFGLKPIDDLLVGFKYIAEIIEKLPDQSDFVFAAEQSLGYLAGSFVRDKDAAIPAMFLAELVSILKKKQQTLDEYLEKLYEDHGYYINKLYTLDMSGKTGNERLFRIMTGLRKNPPQELAGMKVLKIIDRLPEAAREESKYVVGKTGDQITFVFSDDERTKVTIRPSGTEPIAKIYLQHYGRSNDGLAEQASQLEKETVDYVQQF